MSRPRNPRIVGGVFGLDPPSAAPSPPALLNGDPLMLSSGRGALAMALAGLAPRRVWLPAFVCESVLEAITSTVQVSFYAVGRSLCDLDVSGAGPGDVVIVIDYFGWPVPRSRIRELRDAGAVVIEDACQALLSGGVGAEADRWVASPRKFVGVPDGGLLGPGRAGAAEMGPPPARWWLQALEACAGRRAFDAGGGDRSWYEAFRRAEAAVPATPHAMSGLTRMVLTEGIDTVAVAARRRGNYAHLQERLGNLALMGPLPDEVVPIGFPICHPDRDRIRSALFEEGVYPPVHWPVPEAVPQRFVAERRLAASVMTLPCDQRYDEDDMVRVAGLVGDLA